MICKTCKTPIMLDLNKNLHFYGIPSVNKNGIIVSSVFVKTINSRPVFYCNTCKCEMDILLICNICGSYIEVEETCVSVSGELFCQKCLVKYDIKNTQKVKLEIAE